tara:strand:+ start:77094 stop:78452 length:1359 start_codon:yes stop_codon:yes gene_type:complete
MKSLLFCFNFCRQTQIKKETKGPLMIKNTIEFETTRKDLTHLSGLVFFQKLVKSTSLDSIIGQIIPSKKRLRGQSNKEKFFTALYSFIAGADCIEDIEMLKHDPLFNEIANKPCSAVTMERFLKSFKLKTYEKLQNELARLAYRLREKLYPDNNALILSMDSTPHQQYGKYMEGVDWNYKNMWCLDSQNCFDQFGFCYGWHLREGNTYSANGAVEMLTRIFNNIPKNKDVFFRADSAYGNKGIYNSLLTNRAHFAICLKENVWKPLLRDYESKVKWKKTDIYFFDSNKCEIGSCLYPLKDLAMGRTFLRVVFIRAKKKRLGPGDKEYYHHYAVVTDMSDKQMNDERVIKFYKKRANVENQIKDLKNGMDFKHFPCQKLNANRAWGMIAIYAYNLMRFGAHKLHRKKGCFLKTVRREMIFIASEIRKGQRKIKLRFTNHMYQEVKRLEIMMTS